LALGVLTFVVRFWWPVGSGLAPLNLQLCFFVQYIAMLIVGVIAYRNDWLTRLPKTTGRLGLGLAIFMVVVVFPAMFLLGGAASGDISKFVSGWHWQAFAYAVWEQLTGVAMMVGLIVLFRERCNHQNRLLKEAAAGSYATYLIHATVLILFTLAVRSIAIYPLLKFALVSLILVPLCFAVGAALRRLPGARRIL
jgi:membrane-bound acyltransferase YfiQ involved in biofilm formation